MSHENANRLGWLVGWLGQWRGRPNAGVPGASAWAAEHSESDQSDQQDSAALSEWDHCFDDMSSAADTDDMNLFTAGLAARQVKAAVEQLPSREREILLLHVNSGLTYWEIAGRLGLAEHVVLSELSRAYSQLRVDLTIEELRR